MTEDELRFRPWLMDPERDYTEDFDQDNGCYLHMCALCNRPFTGHKHRPPFCKLCQK